MSLFKLITHEEDPLLGNEEGDLRKTIFMSASELWARGQVPTAEMITEAMMRLFTEVPDDGKIYDSREGSRIGEAYVQWVGQPGKYRITRIGDLDG